MHGWTWWRQRKMQSLSRPRRPTEQGNLKQDLHTTTVFHLSWSFGRQGEVFRNTCLAVCPNLKCKYLTSSASVLQLNLNVAKWKIGVALPLFFFCKKRKSSPHGYWVTVNCQHIIFPIFFPHLLHFSFRLSYAIQIFYFNQSNRTFHQLFFIKVLKCLRSSKGLS